MKRGAAVFLAAWLSLLWIGFSWGTETTAEGFLLQWSLCT